MARLFLKIQGILIEYLTSKYALSPSNCVIFNPKLRRLKENVAIASFVVPTGGLCTLRYVGDRIMIECSLIHHGILRMRLNYRVSCALCLVCCALCQSQEAKFVHAINSKTLSAKIVQQRHKQGTVNWTQQKGEVSVFGKQQPPLTWFFTSYGVVNKPVVY